MPGFNQVFGGSTVAPAAATFLLLDMAASVELAWPIEQAVNGLVVADTIEVNATGPGLNVDIPDARQVSSGYTTCFNNTGGNTVSVRNAVGATILSLVPGSAWVIYLADNSTEAGVWRVFQLGASVSVAVAAALAGAGLRAIVTTLNQDIPITSFSATPTTWIDADRAKFMNWTGGLGAVNLPDAATVGNGWFIQVRNSGSGDLTITPPSGTIDGSANKTFAVGTSATIVTDGINYITLGFGSGSGGGGAGFDFVEINVAGSGNFTLAGANLNRIAYRFTGVLTGNRTIIVPNSIQQYWVANATTGAFSLFVRTAGQTPPGIEVLQNNQAIMYCDSVNVIDAESSTVSFPIPVAQGGTGAVTAATARTNLGATAVGDALFTAASQAAAQSALGIVLTVDNLWTSFQTVTSADPAWELNETDAAANNRRWSLRVVAEQLRMTLWNDARNASVDFMTVDRTANVVDIVNFLTALLQYNSVEVGLMPLVPRTFNATDNTVAADRGKILYFTGAAGQTFTFDADPPTDTVITVVNVGSGSLAIAASGTLSWINGSGAIPTGARTLNIGSVMTAHHLGSGNWRTWGMLT